MKPLPSLTTLLVYALSILSVSTHLFAETYGDLTYMINEDSITITDCDENVSGLLNIPAVIEGKPVTTVGPNAFNDCDQLTSVTIPDSVTSLNRVTFTGCNSLTNIDVNAANLSFSSHNGVLFNKAQTTLIQYPAGIIGSYVIPDTVTTIGKFAFAHNDHLNSVRISSSVDSIEGGTFYNCVNLTNATFNGDAPSTFGARVFSSTASDFTVYFYEGASGFTEPEWEGYPSVMIPAALIYEVDGDSITITDCDENASGLLSIPAVIEGKPVTTIADSAFQDCVRLTSVVIPDSVTSVGDFSFEGCSSLTSATFSGDAPGSFRRRIGRDAFSATALDFTVYFYEDAANFTEPTWESYLSVMIPAALTYEVNGNSVTITDCDLSASGELDIPAVIQGKPVTTIGDLAFSSCSNLTSVTIPNSVTTIGDSVFSNCTNLTSVTFNGDTPSSVGSSVFDDTAIGFTVYFYESAIGFTEATWQGYPSVALLDNLYYLDYEVNADDVAIIYCRLNASGEFIIPAVIEGKPVRTIEDSAFSGCFNLTRVTIPDGVTTIGNSAFEGCDNLTAATIPNSVITIGIGAFRSCESLTSVTIPDSVTTIEPSTFIFCRSLASVTIPNSVVTIGDHAFSYCISLTTATIPNSVITIGIGAFSSCGSLTSVTIPDSVTTIEYSAFYYCSSLTNVIIPDSVTTIGDFAFHSCYSLSSVTIPNSVVTIGNSAFSYCSNLTSVTIPNSVITIGDLAFSQCDGLTSVTIPNSVITIGQYAFSNCDNLTSVTIGNSVATIESHAFYNCSSLTRVTFNGDAPTSAPIFPANSVTIYFYEDASNFTAPTWWGYPSIELSLNSDDDGDNWPNHLERLLGTSPLDGNSHFKTWLSQGETGLQIHYAPYSESCEFVVESTIDLSDPESWHPVVGLSFSGDVTEQTAELTTTSESAVFYRISVNEIE